MWEVVREDDENEMKEQQQQQQRLVRAKVFCLWTPLTPLPDHIHLHMHQHYNDQDKDVVITWPFHHLGDFASHKQP